MGKKNLCLKKNETKFSCISYEMIHLDRNNVLWNRPFAEAELIFYCLSFRISFFN